jgi:hypothetical protein
VITQKIIQFKEKQFCYGSDKNKQFHHEINFTDIVQKFIEAIKIEILNLINNLTHVDDELKQEWKNIIQNDSNIMLPVAP